MKILFVTWDGPQVSYLEGLFLPIFKKLADSGYDFHVLQFTWGDVSRIESTREACANAGISYQAVHVWRQPVAIGGLLSALYGARLIRKLIRKHKIDAIMPRSTLPALATLLALRGTTLPMLFDADGLPLDERVDFSGQSSSSLIYRLLRDVEAQAVRRADRVLTRSGKAVDILMARAGAGTPSSKFHVVSNGRDENHFKPVSYGFRCEVRKSIGVPLDAHIVIYAGSLGGKYCFPEMLKFFELIREKDEKAIFVVLTSATEIALMSLDKYPNLRPFVKVFYAPSDMVAKYLSCADVGLSLIKSSYSMKAASAIKTGEYLLSGLPVIGTSGIGDSKEICSQSGFALEDMSSSSLESAANWFIDRALPQREEFRAQCRSIGEEHFSLEACASSYLKVLDTLKL
jgi:glycosyltransferase involved in cell wall biosynthesis